MGTCVETLVNASTPFPYSPLPPPPRAHIYFAILIDLNHDTEPQHLNHDTEQRHLNHDTNHNSMWRWG